MGYWIALGIVVITIIAFVIAVIQIVSRVSTSLENVQELEDSLEHSREFLDTNITYLKEKALVQKDYAADITARTNIGLDNLNVLEIEANELQGHMNWLNAHKQEIGQASYEVGKDYVKEEAPRRWKRAKAISKRTVDKQKTRYSKGDR